MADTQIIDRLIVTLGLDPKDFTKGEKEIAKQTLNLEKSVKDSTKGMGESFTGFAKKLLGVASAAIVLKKIVGYVSDVSESTRQLGIDSKNLGYSSASLRNYQNAIELVGGKADAATKTVDGFNKAIFDLTYQGQMSDTLVQLARLGVQFQNADGSARDFNDVLLDTADAIEKSGMSQQMAYQYLKSAGFDEGSAILALQGRATAAATIKDRAGLRQVGEADINAAEYLERGKTRVSQFTEANAIATLQPAANAARSIEEVGSKLVEGVKSLANAAAKADISVKGLANSLEHTAKVLENRSRRTNTVGLRNNNPLNIRAVGNQPRDNMGFRIFGSMDEGIRAANAQLDRYADKGVDTIDAIVDKWAPASDGNDTEAYKNFLAKYMGVSRTTHLGHRDHAQLIGGMGRYESGPDAPTWEDVADVLTYQNDDVPPTPGAQASVGSTTNVQIDNMTVNTQATDAEGVASGMNSALRRKINASHAERGVQ